MKKLFVLILFVSSCVVNNGYYYPVHKKTDPQVSYTEKQNATFRFLFIKKELEKIL